MRLLLDADAIIKLYHAGVLARVVSALSCAVPQTVYDEVVTIGKQRLHEDAAAIEVILAGAVDILGLPPKASSESGVGAGEAGILTLLPGEPGAVVVSDDRRFLRTLTARGIPFLVPAAMVVVLAQSGLLTEVEAVEALDRLRSSIRAEEYWEARQKLNS